MRKQVVKILIIGAVKVTGLRSVSDTISYVEESLTGDEVEKMTGFLGEGGYKEAGVWSC